MSERSRVAVCAAAGAAAFVGAIAFAPWQLAVLAGWIVTSSTLSIWIRAEISGLDADATALIATREDDSRAAARAVLVGASIASLVAVVIGLHRASSASLALESTLTAASMVTVVLSWLTVHTLYTLRYAHLYYGGQQVGGIVFPGRDRPDYHDFDYFSFTIGMTFQVSDAQVTDRSIRRTVLRHALLSYLFGTAIIASTISVIAGLVA